MHEDKIEKWKDSDCLRRRIGDKTYPFSFLLEGKKMKDQEILTYIQFLTDERFESIADVRKALKEQGKYSIKFQNFGMLLMCLKKEEEDDL